MFKKIDKWIALRTYPILARMNARALSKNVKGRKKLAQAVYRKDLERYRKYGIKPNDIEKVIE